MRVKIYGEFSDEFDVLEADVCNVQQVMACIKMNLGEKVSDHIINNPHYFFLKQKQSDSELVPLIPDMVTMPFDEFDTLIITPDISGDYGALVVIAIAIVLAVAVVLLAPTPEIDSSDPSDALSKDSSLFNGSLNPREEGGSVPLNYGNSRSNGVLISSGIYTEDA